MSYCRFGDSDAYIFMTYKGFDCCACSLITNDQEPVGPFTTARQMLDHIAEHRLAGDNIPEDVDIQIMSEFPDANASVVETDEEREQRIKDSAPARERIRAAMRKAYEEDQL